MNIYVEDIFWFIAGIAVAILMLMLIVALGMSLYMMFMNWQVDYAMKLASMNSTVVHGLWFL